MRPTQLLLLLPVIAALASSGCASTPEGDGIASLGDADAAAEPEGAEVDPEEALLAFTDCMREQGVPMEDPEAGGGFSIAAGAPDDDAGDAGDADQAPPEVVVNGEPVDAEVFEAAEAACREHLDGVVGDRELDPAERAEMEDQMLAFAACMREQGVDWADPDFDGSPPDAASDEPAVDLDDPAVQAAMEACGEEGVVVHGEARAGVGSEPTGDGGDRGEG